MIIGRKEMIHSQTPWFVLHSPELGKAFESFYRECNEDGVLDKKSKELLLVALTSVFRSPNHTEDHIRRALEVGATKEEIAEVLLLAAAEGAWTQLACAQQIYLKYLGPTSKRRFSSDPPE